MCVCVCARERKAIALKIVFFECAIHLTPVAIQNIPIPTQKRRDNGL